MIDGEMLFKRLRNEGMRKPYRSEQFKKFVREQKFEGTFHHILGSMGSLKSTDLCGVSLSATEHADHQDDKQFNIDAIVTASVNNWKYIEYLENLLKTNRVKF